jgi:dynein light intermediate chain, axonemal
MQYPNTVPESLLRYDHPIFEGLEPSQQPTHPANSKSKRGTNAATTQLEDMVNAMLPPREWTEETGTWMQCVSKQPATRLDVITLQESIDKKIAERQARDTGICPVRDDLYTQAFDELIRQVRFESLLLSSCRGITESLLLSRIALDRAAHLLCQQVTLDGPERGLLLLRVRDEIRMAIDAYKTLYDSSVIFGIKKQLQAEQGMAEMEAEVKSLDENCFKYNERVKEFLSM